CADPFGRSRRRARAFVARPRQGVTVSEHPLNAPRRAGNIPPSGRPGLYTPAAGPAGASTPGALPGRAPRHRSNPMLLPAQNAAQSPKPVMYYHHLGDFDALRIRCQHEGCRALLELEPARVGPFLKKTKGCCPACDRPFFDPGVPGGADALAQLASAIE